MNWTQDEIDAAFHMRAEKYSLAAIGRALGGRGEAAVRSRLKLGPIACGLNKFTDEWPEEKQNKLRGLWAEGHSTAEIARRIGVSTNAVIGKVHRLKLPARPSPIRRTPGAPKRPYQPPRPIARPAGRPPANQEPVKQIAVGAALPHLTVTAIAVPTGIVRECAWPMWDDKERPGRMPVYCCERTRPGGSYCAHHAGLAYVPTRPRGEAGILCPAFGSLNREVAFDER